MSEIKMSDVLLRATEVVISRDGDISTEDGDFACVDIDSIIHLEGELSRLFALDSDDVVISDVSLIKAKAKKYDRLIEENERLREALLDVVALQKKHYGDGMETHLAMVDKAKEIKQLISGLGGE